MSLNSRIRIARTYESHKITSGTSGDTILSVGTPLIDMEYNALYIGTGNKLKDTQPLFNVGTGNIILSKGGDNAPSMLKAPGFQNNICIGSKNLNIQSWPYGSGKTTEDLTETEYLAKENIAIGHNAMYSGKGTGNIAIGKDARTSSAINSFSNIAIGYEAHVDALNTAIQLGTGVNNKSGTLQIWNNNIYDITNNKLSVNSIECNNIECKTMIAETNLTVDNISASGYIEAQYFNATSDKRLKENIIKSDINALDIVNAVDIKEYNFIDNKERQIGLIAQDLQELDINKYFINNSGEYLKVQENKLIYLLWKAVQELSSKLDKN